MWYSNEEGLTKLVICGRRKMAYFDSKGINKILKKSNIGLWAVEFEQGCDPRFYADDTMDDLLGVYYELTPEERFKYHHTCIHEDDLQMFEEYSDKLAIERTEIVYRYLHSELGERYVRCSGIRDASVKDKILVYGTHQDITDTIRMEKDKLHETQLAEENLVLKSEQVYSYNLYRNLMELQTCGILSYKLPSHEIIVMNDAARKLYDIDQYEDVTIDVAANHLKGVVYDNEEETKEKLKRLGESAGQISFAMTIPHRDGKAVHVWSVTRRIEMDNGDSIIISSLQDISALTETQKINLELEEQLDVIQAYGKVYNVSYFIDLEDGSFVELSNRIDGVFELIGESGNAAEKLETFCNKIVYPKHYDVMKEFTNLDTINERLKDREWISQQFESRLSHWSEGYFIAAKRDEEGNCKHLIWGTMNITDSKIRELEQQEELIKATEEAQIANRAKSTFLFNMSHDIRTPMNAIMGFTDLLEKSINDPERIKYYLDKIRNSSDLLLSLINNVLEMARIESGKLVLDEVTIDVNKFVKTFLTIFEYPMEHKEIEFTSRIDVTHNYIYGDPVKLREIYLNILSNAFKYTSKGGSVSYLLEEIPSDKEGYIVIRTKITDTGIGMASEYLPHLYDEFTREKNVTDSKIEGTGLGMPIVKKLVDLMGGTIEVETALGKGTTFVITIEHRISNEYLANTIEKQEVSKTKYKGRRILLAEDNDLNAEITMSILGEAGFEVERAEDGIICIDKISKAEPDYYSVILMDVQMPNMNGYRATELIRKLDDKKKAALPIIAVTANAFAEDRKVAMEAGMDGHIAKPIKVDELFEILNNFI